MKNTSKFLAYFFKSFQFFSTLSQNNQAQIRAYYNAQSQLQQNKTQLQIQQEQYRKRQLELSQQAAQNAASHSASKRMAGPAYLQAQQTAQRAADNARQLHNVRTTASQWQQHQAAHISAYNHNMAAVRHAQHAHQQQQALYQRQQQAAALQAQRLQQAQLQQNQQKYQNLQNHQNLQKNVLQNAAHQQQLFQQQQLHQHQQQQQQQHIGLQQHNRQTATPENFYSCIESFTVKYDTNLKQSDGQQQKQRFRLIWKVRERELEFIKKQQEKYKYYIIHNNKEKDRLELPLKTAFDKKYNTDLKQFSVSLSGAQISQNDFISTFKIQLYDDSRRQCIATKEATCKIDKN